jgi:polyisoprenoid-binding protein YceI
MSTITAQPFTGTYRVQAEPSTFSFAVLHSGAFWYRGVFSDVDGTLTADGDGLTLAGAARVASISVQEPPELRAHLLAPDFFDADRHPEVAFRSSDLALTDDGRVELGGELTIRGVTCPVRASGRWAPPRAAAFGEVAGLELHTALDRRDFGFDWQAPMPDGGDAVGWEVAVDIDLMLMRDVPSGA